MSLPGKWGHFSDILDIGYIHVLDIGYIRCLIKDMLQLVEAARILITRMIPSEWNARQCNFQGVSVEAAQPGGGSP
jgi:hypothetical protein